MYVNLRANIALGLIFAFLVNTLGPIPSAQAQDFLLPAPGAMVHLSPAYTPAYLKGIVIHPENAFKFDFLVDRGDGNLDENQKKEEYTKLIKYFLASLTVPDKDQWVNLSPYEKNRIIASDFGTTEMGRDLLGQDYLLKQITASLMYPESGLGKAFWDKVYERAYKQYGTTNIPVNTFNKVWIVPDEALIYESGNTAYVVKSHLKVMLEEDYLSLEKHSPSVTPASSVVIPAKAGIQSQANGLHSVSSKVIKEIILPEIEREVNEGKNFAMLRQVFSGMVLATWYKMALKESLLGKVYADKAKVQGVNQDPKNNEEIYQRYLRAFKKGVYNYIKEDTDKYTNQVIPRKYFAGGFVRNDEAMIIKKVGPAELESVADPSMDAATAVIDPAPSSDGAMMARLVALVAIVMLAINPIYSQENNAHSDIIQDQQGQNEVIDINQDLKQGGLGREVGLSRDPGERGKELLYQYVRSLPGEIINFYRLRLGLRQIINVNGTITWLGKTGTLLAMKKVYANSISLFVDEKERPDVWIELILPIPDQEAVDIIDRAMTNRLKLLEFFGSALMTVVAVLYLFYVGSSGLNKEDIFFNTILLLAAGCLLRDSFVSSVPRPSNEFLKQHKQYSEDFSYFSNNHDHPGISDSMFEEIKEFYDIYFYEFLLLPPHKQENFLSLLYGLLSPSQLESLMDPAKKVGFETRLIRRISIERAKIDKAKEDFKKTVLDFEKYKEFFPDKTALEDELEKITKPRQLLGFLTKISEQFGKTSPGEQAISNIQANFIKELSSIRSDSSDDLDAAMMGEDNPDLINQIFKRLSEIIEQERGANPLASMLSMNMIEVLQRNYMFFPPDILEQQVDALKTEVQRIFDSNFDQFISSESVLTILMMDALKHIAKVSNILQKAPGQAIPWERIDRVSLKGRRTFFYQPPGGESFDFSVPLLSTEPFYNQVISSEDHDLAERLLAVRKISIRLLNISKNAGPNQNNDNLFMWDIAERYGLVSPSASAIMKAQRAVLIGEKSFLEMGPPEFLETIGKAFPVLSQLYSFSILKIKPRLEIKFRKSTEGNHDLTIDNGIIRRVVIVRREKNSIQVQIDMDRRIVMNETLHRKDGYLEPSAFFPVSVRRVLTSGEARQALANAGGLNYEVSRPTPFSIVLTSNVKYPITLKLRYNGYATDFEFHVPGWVFKAESAGDITKYDGLDQNNYPPFVKSMLQAKRDGRWKLDAAMTIEKGKPDGAMMIGGIPVNGGIDLNSANLDMQIIKRDGNGVPLPISQQDMAQLSQISGFVPRILEIRPVSGLFYPVEKKSILR